MNPPEYLDRTPETCSFRSRSSDVWICTLLEAISGVRDATLCQVREDACAACCKRLGPSVARINDVVASRLYLLATEVTTRGGVAGCDAAKAEKLLSWADENLITVTRSGTECKIVPRYVPSTDYQQRTHLYSCDVVVCCERSTDQERRAVESVLRQENAFTVVHLVDDGGGAQSLMDQFSSEWNVVCHRNPRRRGVFATLHDLLPTLHSQFVAVQCPRTVSRPHRICCSVGLLDDNGADVLGAVLQTPSGPLHPRTPAGVYERWLPVETLVFRRSTLIDMGGFADRGEFGDEDAECVFRAFLEHRGILQSPETMVAVADTWAPSSIGPTPCYGVGGRLLKAHARGLPASRISCDAVMPFTAGGPYLDRVVSSVLDQKDADVVLHLVDDGCNRATHNALKRWSTHPRIRAYRNSRPLGREASVNNVLPYVETRLLTLISERTLSQTGRIHHMGNLLGLAELDAVAGRVETDEDPALFDPSSTLMIAAGAFRRLGGFFTAPTPTTDDTVLTAELLLRARHAGLRIALTREMVCRAAPDAAGARKSERSRIDAAIEEELHRRSRIYGVNSFDPRSLGHLGRHCGLTRPVEDARPK